MSCSPQKIDGFRIGRGLPLSLGSLAVAAVTLSSSFVGERIRQWMAGKSDTVATTSKR
jgi:hypothetical protein